MEFQKILLKVGRALNKSEVKALAFLCTDLLGQNPISVEEASDLFSRLMDQDRLSAERPQLLTELLRIIQRTRLIRDCNLSDSVSTTTSLISSYRTLLYNLSEEITDQDLKNMKFLLDKKLPRRKLEENVPTLEVFLEMEHMELISETNLNLLEEIFQSVCPVLKDKINQFKALQDQERGRPRSASCPFAPNQVPQTLHPGRPASWEVQDFIPPAMSLRDTSNTSMDVPTVSPGGDECEALSQGLTDLMTTTSSFTVKVDELMTSPENKASSENQTPQTTNTEILGMYPMTAATRGICLIINNYDFSESTRSLFKREGTMLDEECLRRVFTWLGFGVEVQRDCKKDEMLSVLKEIGKRNHSQVDSLVCCVLSHGMEGGVYGVDGHAVMIKELKEPVNGINCASLAGKPKLFFIQACQGTSEQKAVYIEADHPVCSDAVKCNESIPCDADFLLGMATVPFSVSFRDKKHGTWFIQSLCQNLVQMVPRGCDILSILTKVNADVSQKTDSSGVKKQMPQPAFSLVHKVVFPIPAAPPPSLAH